MPWCSKCKTEYVEGIETCAVCKSELVDILPDTPSSVPAMQGEEETIKKLVDFLKYSNLESHCIHDEANDSWVAYVSENQINEAGKLIGAFLKAESENAENNKDTDDSEKAELPKKSSPPVYVKKEDTYKDLVSSAYSFIGVSIVGIVILVLEIFGILNFNLDPTGKYLVYAVMGALFVLFMILGIHSLIRSKTVSGEAALENDFTVKINEWLTENISIDNISDSISDDDSPEIVYFKRSEKIKQLVTEEFGELNDAFLDKLVDDFYTSTFE